jgi:cystathionine beta-lyase
VVIIPHSFDTLSVTTRVTREIARSLCGEWLDALVRHLDRNRDLLGELLEEHLPRVRYARPDAGYLAWLDCRELALGDDPAQAFLEQGRVALSSGPVFGEEGRGYARLNFGTSKALLEEAVRRMARAVG